MTASHPILLETNDGLATLTFNRPEKHHAFDEEFIQSFINILEKLDQKPNIRLILIKSSGKSFCSGADLNWMKRMATFSLEENQKDALELDKLMYTLANTKAPTMAVVQGNCFGGALGLLACCNIVIASEQAKFCFSEAKLGLIPAVISPYVIRAVGQRSALKYFLTAELFDAHTALNINLCHEIIVHDKLQARANVLTDMLLNNGPGALLAIKALCLEQIPLPTPSIRAATSEAIAHVRSGKEAQEGMQAFFEKRNPKWIKA